MDNGVLNKHADQDRVAKRAGVLKDGDTQSHRGLNFFGPNSINAVTSAVSGYFYDMLREKLKFSIDIRC